MQAKVLIELHCCCANQRDRKFKVAITFWSIMHKIQKQTIVYSSNVRFKPKTNDNRVKSVAFIKPNCS